jgi:hypothetical protein
MAEAGKSEDEEKRWQRADDRSPRHGASRESYSKIIERGFHLPIDRVRSDALAATRGCATASRR